jgi:hypothetical protein
MNENKAITAEEIIELILDYGPHIRVTHHVPGEIKLNVMLSILGVKNGTDLRALVNAIPAVLKTRHSLLQRSIIIQYDEELFPYELWGDLLQLKEKPELKSQVSNRLQEILDHQFA